MVPHNRPFRYILFDLDDTLYSRNTGLMPAVGERIRSYMEMCLGLDGQEIERLRRDYMQTYGTSLKGLQANYHIRAEEYLAYVHDLPLEKYISRNPALDRMLGEIPLTKIVFTNATEEHAWRVLTVLGIARHFSRIIDIRALEFRNKPDREAYLRILDILGAEPGECILVEDSVRNLRPGKEIGMATILVDGQADECVDFSVPDILQLAGIIRLL
jgi:putative hydrolase of the HAD superfamily